MICKSIELYDHVCLCMQQCGDTSARMASGGGPTAECGRLVVRVVVVVETLFQIQCDIK